MHITRVELENVKSHRHATFEFQRGTTAIMGANGAGKTTIIEAVAWTLFDLLDYKKDDFARRGSKNKGVARVTFQSDLDEREYLVYRDTGTGYCGFSFTTVAGLVKCVRSVRQRSIRLGLFGFINQSIIN